MSWQTQTLDKPLFEDLLWSRPENRKYAGKLLIIGGNLHSLMAPAMAFAAAEKAGVGSVRVTLPDATKKVLGKSFIEAEFAPSTPSGSFSQQALAMLLDSADWADGVLLAGDFGRNSETAILLEKFLSGYKGQVTAAQDMVDYFLTKSSPLLSRKKTLLVLNLGKLQKLAKNNRPTDAVTHNMNLHELVDLLAKWSQETGSGFATKHADNLIVTAQGSTTTTISKNDTEWQVRLAAFMAVWWAQQPSHKLEALTTATFDFLKQS